MSATTMISAEEIGAILGFDFEVPAPTFESVWQTMRIKRVFRKETDFVPDSLLEFYGKLEVFLPIKGICVSSVAVA